MERPILVTTQTTNAREYIEHKGLLVPQGGRLLVPVYPRRLERFYSYITPALNPDLLFGIGDEKREEVIRAAFSIASAQAGIITYMPVEEVDQYPTEILITREGRLGGQKNEVETATRAIMSFISREN